MECIVVHTSFTIFHKNDYQAVQPLLTYLCICITCQSKTAFPIVEMKQIHSKKEKKRKHFPLLKLRGIIHNLRTEHTRV